MCCLGLFLFFVSCFFVLFFVLLLLLFFVRLSLQQQTTTNSLEFNLKDYPFSRTLLQDTKKFTPQNKNHLPHRGLEPSSVLRLAFQSDALPTELSTPLCERIRMVPVTGK